jgi:hypothetical protein
MAKAEHRNHGFTFLEYHVSLPRDLQQLRSSAKLSLDELSEFSRRLRGKSAAEALGTIAQSQLGRALLEATGLVALILLLGTVPFYFVAGKRADISQPAAATPATTTGDAAGNDAGSAAARPGVEPLPAQAAAGSNLPATVEEAEKKLGLDTAAPALDPRANPLERKGDDLLKDLK